MSTTNDPTTTTNPPADIPSPDKTPQTFDKVICGKFAAFIHDQLIEHPELRTVTTVFDYAGGLNEGRTDAGVWVGRDGLPNKAEEMFGSLRQTLRVAAFQLDRAAALIQHHQQRISELGAEIVAKRKELEELNAGT